ncbi:MAG: carbamoyltransferase HypF, partial [Anaerolineae bacterium]
MTILAGTRIHITGIVQGVGFRPFVYGLAQRYELTGWVRNTSAGVDIEADGRPPQIEAFIHALQTEAPPLARIDRFEVNGRATNSFTCFEIIPSQPVADAFQPISPDVSLCADCQRELFDPADRRYRYPFINCTNCGPRFTIIQDIPYDRPQTTMSPFPMCPDCEREYHDPLDRRFHAQPVACPVCGPHVWLESGERGTGSEERGAAIAAARRLIMAGQIVAVKGLGGFHLVCDATNETAVTRLRARKLRVDKPFAVMMWDETAIARHCRLTPAEKELLESRARPIVILQQHDGSQIAASVTPNQRTLGVMLPYTPLHLLLLEPAPGFPDALVMTSGNLSEEPIAYTNEDALARLAAIADAFLLHNRAIHTRCDDSVMRVVPVSPTHHASRITHHVYPLRRSRGYAPFPVKLPWRVPPILATGAELKNTFCVTRDEYAFLSHHIGDMENYETLCSFEEGAAHFERLFRIRPEILAYDMHPNYLASRYAQERAER